MGGKHTIQKKMIYFRIAHLKPTSFYQPMSPHKFNKIQL